MISTADVSSDIRDTIFDALQRKSVPDLERVIGDLPEATTLVLRALITLHGSPDVLLRARSVLAAYPAALQALDEVEQVVTAVRRRHPSVSLYVDLAELRSFRYHTGLVFAAYIEGYGSAVAKGGRYDNVGSVFGRRRPATGFACDLKALAAASRIVSGGARWISAPTSVEDASVEAIAALRAQGHVVVTALAGAHDPRCTEQLIKRGDSWVCESLSQVETQ